METPRLLIRPLSSAEREAFLQGISERELCRMYGFPENLGRDAAGQIFDHFAALGSAYALLCRGSGELAGFVTDVPPELPEDIRSALPPRGRTFAYATFAPFRRRGLMREALQALIGEAFRRGAGFIHCGHFDFNEPSALLLKQLGFSEYGRHGAGGKTIIDELLFAAPAETVSPKE